MIDRLVRDDDAWKPNVGLVLTDFLVRHGRVPADDAAYLDRLLARPAFAAARREEAASLAAFAPAD